MENGGNLNNMGFVMYPYRLQYITQIVPLRWVTDTQRTVPNIIVHHYNFCLHILNSLFIVHISFIL